MIDSSFRIGAEWRDATSLGDRDIARIRMEAGTQVVSRVLDVQSGEVRDFFRASAVSLGLWLVDNWWRLRWEPLAGAKPSYDWRLRHEISSAGAGFNWPPIMAYGTGPRVVLAPAFGGRASSGPIRYLDMDTVHVMPGEHFEAGLDRFLGQVIASCAGAKDGAVLTKMFAELQHERSDAGVAAWRALEARLGFDPDAAPAALIESLGSKEAVLGRRAVEEAAVASPGIHAAKILDEAVEASTASGLLISVGIADQIDPSRFDAREPAWRWGEDAARKVREALGATRGPFHSEAFEDLLQASWQEISQAPATAYRLPYAALLRRGSSTAGLALQMKPTNLRRFELARIVADLIWMKGEALGVISRAKTERQKFQRAFAQALLCPFSEVRHYIDLEDPTSAQMNRAARDLGVHVSAIKTLLVNRNVLPRETLLDRLEAA